MAERIEMLLDRSLPTLLDDHPRKLGEQVKVKGSFMRPPHSYFSGDNAGSSCDYSFHDSTAKINFEPEP